MTRARALKAVLGYQGVAERDHGRLPVELALEGQQDDLVGDLRQGGYDIASVHLIEAAERRVHHDGALNRGRLLQRCDQGERNEVLVAS